MNEALAERLYEAYCKGMSDAGCEVGETWADVFEEHGYEYEAWLEVAAEAERYQEEMSRVNL